MIKSREKLEEGRYLQILMFSPEYPPLLVGGLARHVQPLSETLVKQGHGVTVITQMASGTPEEELKNGVDIIRVNPLCVNAPDFATSVLQTNFEMVQAAGRLLLEGKKYEIIHGHDWLVIMAARTLKHQLRIPLMMTIHATEHGRNHGIYTGLQRYINDLEWLSCYEAWRVIVCSEYMNREIQYLFQVPQDKIDIIENGVNPAEFAAHPQKNFRERYAHPSEKIVFFVGRLVQEKGVQVLIDAIPEILATYPQTKFVIAGKGPKESELKHQAQIMGVADRCYFTGFISDEVRNHLYQACDLAVFPSLYEPFGIVALEAMAARVPVLVTHVGGLGEIVEDGVDGFRVRSGSAHELAQGILRALQHPDQSRRIGEAGYQKAVGQYNWPGITQKTIALYQRVQKEYLDSPWGQETMDWARLHDAVGDERIQYRYQNV